MVYAMAERKLGLDAADLGSVTANTYEIKGFPFAHLIFNFQDSERIAYFLSILGKEIGRIFPNGSVPHFICQGENGILVAPAKNYLVKGPGAGDIAGHIVCKSEEEFSSADFSYCMNKLSSALFKRDEINLKKFL
jgi:hypothetical protein